MAKVKLNSPVLDLQGKVTTCAALLDNGRAYVEQSQPLESRRSKSGYVTLYFCHLLDADGKVGGSFEIGQKAYESRASVGQNVKPDAPVLREAAAAASAEQSPVLPEKARFYGHELTVGDFAVMPAWDEQSTSYEFTLTNNAEATPIIDAMRQAFPIVEVNSAIYGESLVVNFSPHYEIYHITKQVTVCDCRDYAEGLDLVNQWNRAGEIYRLQVRQNHF